MAVYTKCIGVYDRSFKVLQVIASKKDGAIKSACETVMVCFDGNKKESMPMPDHWRVALECSMAQNAGSGNVISDKSADKRESPSVIK